MNTLILVAGAAALAFTAPALANPGHGHGGPGNHGYAHGASAHRSAHGWAAHAKHGVATRHGGRLYALDRRGGCPPGLARKNSGCLPPGQARKYYNVGQRYNRNFGYSWSYAQIPYDLRSQYQFDQNDRYYYRNGYLYQVDPRTLLVQQVVSALLR